MSSAIEVGRLTRPRRVLVGGVCLGVAAHLGWKVRRVRALAVVLALCGGAGILLYLWLWALTPLDPFNPATPDDRAEVTRSVPVATLFLVLSFLAGITTVSVEGFLSGPQLNPGVPVLMFFAAATVAWSLGFDRPDPNRSDRRGFVMRTIAAGLVILTGVILLLSSGARPRTTTAVLAVVLVVFGVGVLVAPSVTRFVTDQLAERATRVREVQRAEIAAHLHDSVLQTLALIQVRAGASSEVARLARAQERELRDWLFAGTTPDGNDIATALREVAAAIELDYPARLEVVVVGEPHGAANPSLVAATREAMVNAARHAGGEIAVYLENSADAVDVFVRDRGPGFDIDALAADRLGVRESIIGRMARAGGTATVGPGAGGTGAGGTGTEVHLHLETGTAHG